MAFWWVNQGKTWKREIPDGFIWAPLKDRGGAAPFHWKTLADVTVGDTIFSYVDRSFRAVGTARGAFYEAANPGNDFDEWESRGRRVDVNWRVLPQAVRIAPILQELLALMPDSRSPLMRNGKGFTGYFFELPDPAGRFLLGRLGLPPVTHLEEPTADPNELLYRSAALTGCGPVPKPSGQRTPRRKDLEPTSAFARLPQVVAYVRQRAKGMCELCTAHAPFTDDDGEPFLEVHHVVTLANGGPDTPENAVAVCPNCHRLLHHGRERQHARDRLYASVLELRRPVGEP